MRWIPYIILVFVAVVLQAGLLKVLSFTAGSAGVVAPDLSVVIVIFAAMNLRDGKNVMLAGWLTGFIVDLTTAGGPAGYSAVGPMAIAYSLIGWLVFHIRDVVFKELVVTKVIMAFAFCILGHGSWLICQWILAGDDCRIVSFSHFLWQMLAVAIFTAAVAPPVYYCLRKIQYLLIHSAPHDRRGRSRRR